MVSSETAPKDVLMTDDEIAQYDRQIRLWGIDAQRRLKASKILIVGFSYLANEVAKNLALVGVKQLTIVNQHHETEGMERFEEALNRIRRLNPMVEVASVKEGLSTVDDNIIADFNVLLVSNSTRLEVERLRSITHKNGVPLFVGDTFGLFGFFFADLGEQLAADGEIVKKERFLPFTDFRAGKSNGKNRAVGAGFMLSQMMLEFREKKGRLPDVKHREEDAALIRKLRDEIREITGAAAKVTDAMIENVYGDEVSVGAVVGGVLSQEVVRAISQQEKAIDNFFFFDSFAISGIVQKLSAE